MVQLYLAKLLKEMVMLKWNFTMKKTLKYLKIPQYKINNNEIHNLVNQTIYHNLTQTIVMYHIE